MVDAEDRSEPKRRRKVARIKWIFALDLVVAAVFLVFGNTTGRIIGAALLVALALLFTRGIQRRRSGGGAENPRTTVLVHRLLAVAGLFAIASGIYGLFANEAALAIFLLALGGYCLFEARKNLRRKPTGPGERGAPLPPAD